MNKKIRAAVVKRADGSCEGCGKHAGEAGHFDHFFSRRHGESIETGWLLCPPCDADKTASRPSAAHWLGLFIAHCWKYGFHEEAERAATKLAVLIAKGMAA